jgi:hypothetical protein
MREIPSLYPENQNQFPDPETAKEQNSLAVLEP